ncbi:MAG: SGNH/GDSL hydrolase family protein [Planctomycetota bacterium]
MKIFRLMIALFSTGLTNPILAEASTEISQRENDYAQVDLHAEQLEVKKWRYPAKELHIRAGLPNFLKKARAGEDLTIAYFGGSITAHEGWRPMSFTQLEDFFPQARLKMVNAAIGGTGSVVGVFRADDDLLLHNPDLVFIEFAVNDRRDTGKKPKDVIRALEGIVRKLKTQNPDVDICFFYTLNNHDIETLNQGYAQPAVAAHEVIAEHYQIPSIYAGPGVAEMIRAGEAVFTGKITQADAGLNLNGQLVITEDKTHPTIPHGHRVYADVVGRSLNTIFSTTGRAADIPAPLYTPTWESAKTLPAHGNATFTGNWEKVGPDTGPRCFRFGNRFYDWFPHLYRTETPGASVKIRFRGSMIGIKGVRGPDSGVVEIQVNDQLPFKENLFTVYNTRPSYGGEPLDELHNGEHIVVWSLASEIPNKQAILASYHREGNDRDLIENPEKYEPNRFSVGQIVLIGEIIHDEQTLR